MKEIEVRKLKQHPKNVRRTYPDLTELTESIREVGVLQNLTVVPDPADEGYYLVVIGNCRLQAARNAGLHTVPCQVVEMTEQEQIQTMLTENMQRRDLTVIEEARGVQMCIDLGIKPADLAKKTGLSRRTIYERKAIASLDLEEDHPEATIQDYLKVTELKDKENRDELLKAIGTPNFSWKYNELRKKEDSAVFFKTITPYALEHAKEAPERPKWNEYDKSWSVESKADLDKIEWEKDAEYAFVKSTYSPMITVYKLTNKNDDEEDDEDRSEYERQKEERRLAREVGENWGDIARTRRMEYIRELRRGEYGPINKDKLIVWMARNMFEYDLPDTDIYLEVMEEDGPEEYEDDTAEQDMIAAVQRRPGDAVVLVYSILERYKDAPLPTMTGFGTYIESESYQKLYDFMHDFGYRLSPEEKALLDGTHEIYIKEDEEDDNE